VGSLVRTLGAGPARRRGLARRRGSGPPGRIPMLKLISAT